MAVHEIRVFSAENDSRGREVLHEAHTSQKMSSLVDVRTARVYRLEGISEEEARTLAEKLLVDPVTQEGTVNDSEIFETQTVVDIGYKPGVMDPVEDSLLKGARDLGIAPTSVATSTEYGFFGTSTPDDIESLVSGFLMNQTVEQIIQEKPETLVHEATPETTKKVPLRKATDEELMDLSKDKLFLDQTEMRVIQNHFETLNREPTDVELETIAARQSEHCGHKTFHAEVIVDGKLKAPFINRIKEKSKKFFKNGFVRSAFNDNAGVIEAYDGYTFNAKVETHNSPSAIEPYGGAMTGSGGVFRDIAGTGKGFKNIISTFMYCFAPRDTADADLPPGTLRPDYIERRVIKGVGDYGNRMGIPTGNGSAHYHPDFRAKPTVMVGAYGIAPEEYAEQGKPQVGDLVVVIGGRTGRDGIHGATFSSGEMTDRTQEVNSSAVQIGNAIEEKRMFDALIEARDADLIRAITDCGAAGFCSAIGELGEEIGVTVDISKAPLKYSGLTPWEIWISESQERMVSAIAPEDAEKFMEICKRYNVESTVLGKFDGSHTLTLNYGEENVAELDYEFLINGFPQRQMEAYWESRPVEEIKPEAPADEQEWIDRLKAVLSHGNVCSKEEIFRSYDHGVQGGNIVPPYGGHYQSTPNDALVIRPILDKEWGIVQSHGMNPVLNNYDPYKGTVWAIADATSKFVSAGGNLEEAAAVGNYVWPFPDKRAMGSLDMSVDAVVDMMEALELPVISGKDSLSSTYRGSDGEVIEIPPVYTMSVFGRIPNVEKTMTADIKKPGGSALYLVGQPSGGMAGSVYYDVVGGSTNEFPEVDVDMLPKTLHQMRNAIASGKILASHSISEGGLLATVAEMSFGSNSGAQILVSKDVDPEKFLFSATAGCFVVEVDDETTLEELFEGVPIKEIGLTLREPQMLVHHGKIESGKLFKASMEDLKYAWQRPLLEALS